MIEDDNVSKPIDNQAQDRLNRKILIVILIIATISFVPLIAIFFVPLVLAVTFTTLFYPLYDFFFRLSRRKRNLASISTCAVLLLGILVPVYLLIHLMVLQAIDAYGYFQPTVSEIISKGGESEIAKKLHSLPIIRNLDFSKINWNSILQQTGSRVASVGSAILNRTYSGVFGLATTLFVMLFTMFYFFKDGSKLIDKIRYLVPLKQEYANMVITRFAKIARATIKGTVIIGLLQGTLGAITLLIFGVNGWLLWGFVMIFLSIIPMLGSWLVLIPAGIIQIILGDIWQGVGILAMSIIVVSNVDNLLRPRLVGHGAGMHDLMIFFSTLGGLSLFGVMGFIVGPAIASLFISVLDIYQIEFDKSLSSVHNSTSEISE